MNKLTKTIIGLLCVTVPIGTFGAGLTVSNSVNDTHYTQIVQAQDSEIDAITENVTKLQESLVERENQLTLLNVKYKQISDEKVELETTLAEKEVNITSLQTELENTNKEHTEKVASLNSQISTLTEEKGNIQTQLDEKITALNQLQTEIDEIEINLQKVKMIMKN